MTQSALFGDLSLFGALKTKMHWHQGRQRILAENVANADSPNYRARDLKAPSFAELVKPSQPSPGVMPARTDPAHLTGFALSSDPSFAKLDNTDWEVTPEGNGVVIEDQMMKIADNQMEYQLATTLYTRSLGLLRTALGRRG